MDKLNALRDEVFANNKANGWHEQQRSFGELIALVHSEVSEALEDYRNKKAINEIWYEYKLADIKNGLVMFGEVYYDAIRTDLVSFDNSGTLLLGKPCGIPSELADVVIRILDICGLYGWDIEKEYRTPKLLPSPKSFVEELTSVHLYLSFAYYYEHIEDDAADALDHLTVAVILVRRICVANAIDLESIIRQKLEYNKTRGHRHGGKVI